MHNQLTNVNISLLARILFANVLLLGLLHMVGVAIELYAPNHLLSEYTGWFDLDREYNVPTFYSGLVLVSIAFVGFLQWFKTKYTLRKFFWIGFSMFFLYWAIDEVMVLHERLAQPVRDLLQIGQHSVLYHAWVVVAMGLAGLLGGFVVVYSNLERRTLSRNQVNILAIIFAFMVGIIVLEIAGTKLYSNPRLYRFGIIPLEELFEISMSSYLLIKLLRYRDKSS
jgi:hypothetical protein